MVMSLLLLAQAGPPVTVESRPAYVALVRNVEGGYSQHAAIARSLLAAARAGCGAEGVVYGVYPQDPDAVPESQLRWQLGYRMKAGTRCRRATLTDLALERHPAEQVARLQTSLADARQAGLSLFHWLADSGYVQTGPTRMEYRGDGGPATRVVILLPVRLRPDRARAPVRAKLMPIM
jgi:hypothetical protein